LTTRGRIKDVRVDRVANHNGLAKLEAELPVLFERVLRLHDRRVGELAVDAEDSAVGAVVETAVDADRPVDPVHHPHLAAGEAAQPREVEVKGVVKTRSGASGEPVRV